MMNTLDNTCQFRRPNPHLDDEVNRNIIRSEIEGGVYLRDLPVAGRLEIQTESRTYTLVNQGSGEAFISGHPEICPEPVLVTINGSN